MVASVLADNHHKFGHDLPYKCPVYPACAKIKYFRNLSFPAQTLFWGELWMFSMTYHIPRKFSRGSKFCNFFMIAKIKTAKLNSNDVNIDWNCIKYCIVGNFCGVLIFAGFFITKCSNRKNKFHWYEYRLKVYHTSSRREKDRQSEARLLSPLA